MKSTNGVQQVDVVRTGANRVAVDKSNPVLDLSRLLSGLTSVGASPLAVRPEQQLAATDSGRSVSIPPIRISLHEGALVVNNKRVPIPLGLSRRMTGRQFKEFAGIYRGNMLFVRVNGGLQRIKESESVEVLPDAEFTHHRESPPARVSPLPAVSSFSTYLGD